MIVMWAKCAIAMLCCSSLSAWAADPWCSPRGKPAFTFEWLAKGKANPDLGSVRIRDAAGKTVQVLADVENYYRDSESFGTGTDFNNDGCADLTVTSSVAGIGNRSSTVFLYNPRTRRFEANEALSTIGGLALDPKDKNCVNGDWKGGAEDMYASRHCWKAGKLVLMSEYQVSPLYGPEGEFACYEHVETEYRGGKKREKKSCTKEF